MYCAHCGFPLQERAQPTARGFMHPHCASHAGLAPPPVRQPNNALQVALLIGGLTAALFVVGKVSQCSSSSKASTAPAAAPAPLAHEELLFYTKGSTTCGIVLVGNGAPRAGVIALARALHARAPEIGWKIVDDRSQVDAYVKYEKTYGSPGAAKLPQAWYDAHMLAKVVHWAGDGWVITDKDAKLIERL